MCGIIGIYNHPRAADLAVLGLFAEQHRGQESCGIAVNNSKIIKLRKKIGLVKDVFPEDKISALHGKIAIGHVRYPTRGISAVENSQPHIVETLSGPSYALASNGDILNYKQIRAELEQNGVYFASFNDGELLLKFIVFHVEKNGLSIPEAIKLLMKNVKGAYSTVLSTKTKMYLFRDPLAIRPMCYGKTKDGSYAVASESCALDILYMEWIKEVQAAQIIEIDEDKVSVFSTKETQKNIFTKHCIFEHIYFSRPDSFIFGENVFHVRKKIGKILAQNDDFDPDIVVPVPDSANFIALGYAREKNLPYEMGLIRNHYVGRTFIKPEQTIRDESVYQKFNPLPHFFQDKKVALIDDSIVRGTTLRKIVKLVRHAGAKEIHLRIGSPPVKHSCYYGIDTPTRQELIANEKDSNTICKYLKADSLKYLTIKQLQQAVQDPQNYCYACFNGEYPIK